MGNVVHGSIVGLCKQQKSKSRTIVSHKFIQQAEIVHSKCYSHVAMLKNF